MNKILLTSGSELWETVLTQIGIPCRIMAHDDGLADRKEIRAVIVNGIFDEKRILQLRDILAENTVFIYLPIRSQAEQVLSSHQDFLWSGENYCFGIKLEIHKADIRLGRGEFWFPLKFAFPPSGSSVRKQFYYPRRELPSERVSRINYGEIFRFINNFLVHALSDTREGLSAYSALPDNKPLFIFRVDTDFAGSEMIRKLYLLCRKYDISATWFCDVHSEEVLKIYREFASQEIALHCDRHYVYSSVEENRENIKRARELLNRYGLYPCGFAAPFGEWNTALETALISEGFIYSSEFSFAYDSLPVYRKTSQGDILQIPIHPISPGRLRRAHFSSYETIDYYQKYIDYCLKTSMPALIYHHPGHNMLKELEAVFDYIKGLKMKNLSLLGYASWWQKRWQALHDQASSELLNLRKAEYIHRDHPADFQRVHNRNWRWYLQEYESHKGKEFFKKYGYPHKVIKGNKQ